jgi:hypothetical protein
MSVLSQFLFSFVSGNFMPFPLASAGHYLAPSFNRFVYILHSSFNGKQMRLSPSFAFKSRGKNDLIVERGGFNI